MLVVVVGEAGLDVDDPPPVISRATELLEKSGRRRRRTSMSLSAVAAPRPEEPYSSPLDQEEGVVAARRDDGDGCGDV